MYTTGVSSETKSRLTFHHMPTHANPRLLKFDSISGPPDPHDFSSRCHLFFLEAVCLAGGDQEVLGLHFVGPNAGEVMQGFSAAMQ